MLVQAFIDDSGGKGQGPVFVFSALIATAERWAQFSDEWQSVLDSAPPITHFKMHEAASRNGQFSRSRFSKQQRDDKLRRLAGVLNDAAFVESWCTADLSAFDRIVAPVASKPMSEPYFLSFQMTISQIAGFLYANGLREPFEIIFDEHVIFGPRTRVWYPIMRAISNPQIRAILPVEPIFRSDLDTLPLQAADLTAWRRRRNASGVINEFAWLDGCLSKLLVSDFSHKLGEKEFAQMISYGFQPGQIPELEWKRGALAKAYRETFGDDPQPQARFQPHQKKKERIKR